jgi:D-arabinose 1-dehydrogenase-like Zn-dependent alcohol dehydrogenase
MSRTIEAIIKRTGATSEKKSASATTKTMKAIRIHNYGGPEVLHYEDAPRPEPQAGEVLVRVHAAGVNPIDWKVREGHMKDFWPHKLPLILGWDLSGTIEAVGPGPAAAGRFKIGDEVYSVPDPTRNGAYADYIVVREPELALKPNSLHHIRAAAVPLAALTAWQSLFDTAQLQPGQRVLIHAGSGGVGHLAVRTFSRRPLLKIRTCCASSAWTSRSITRNNDSKTSRATSTLCSTQSAAKLRNALGQF